MEAARYRNEKWRKVLPMVGIVHRPLLLGWEGSEIRIVLDKLLRKYRMRSATQSDWKTLPLPEQRGTIELDLRFTPAELEQIKRGVIPVYRPLSQISQPHISSSSITGGTDLHRSTAGPTAQPPQAPLDC